MKTLQLCAYWCFILIHNVTNTKFVANRETFLIRQNVQSQACNHSVHLPHYEIF